MSPTHAPSPLLSSSDLLIDFQALSEMANVIKGDDSDASISSLRGDKQETARQQADAEDGERELVYALLELVAMTYIHVRNTYCHSCILLCYHCHSAPPHQHVSSACRIRIIHGSDMP
jgi:hypothetical protein